MTDNDPSRYVPENALELAIGRQVRAFRISQGITVADLAKQANLSSGMLSKVENGLTSPSLATLHALGQALNVPVTSLFRKYEETREATNVKSGEGLTIERQGNQGRASVSAFRSFQWAIPLSGTLFNYFIREI